MFSCFPIFPIFATVAVSFHYIYHCSNYGDNLLAFIEHILCARYFVSLHESCYLIHVILCSKYLYHIHLIANEFEA